MKKIYLILVLFCISIASYSQVEKGDKAATFFASYMSTEGYSFGLFSAKLGEYFTQNIEAGVKPQLQLGEGFSAFGLGIYGTYNFLTTDGKILPYAGLEVSLLTQSFDALPESSNKTDAGLYAGAKFFLTESLNIDANLNYLGNITNNSDVDLPGTFMFNVGIGFLIGKLK